jgi:hypothetical protein
MYKTYGELLYCFPIFSVHYIIMYIVLHKKIHIELFLVRGMYLICLLCTCAIRHVICVCIVR